ncbi:MAG: ATP-binding cassette domain-containing protein, partial [SAR202 cluster bacterium]
MKIRVENLSFSYHSKQVIKDINMEISDLPTGVVGPNGSGKTTILKLLGGLLKPPNNKVFIDDKDVN